MSSRRRTSPPPESMAGPSLILLGLVGILVGVSLLVSLGLFGFGLYGFRLFGLGGLSGLSLLDRGVLGLDLVDGLRNVSRRVLDHGLLSSRSCLGRRGLLRRSRAPGAVGLRRHRLLPHQLDDGHRGVVALARLHLDDAGVAA